MKVYDSVAVQAHHHCIDKLLQLKNAELKALSQIIHAIPTHYIFACMDTSAYNAL